MRAHRRRESGKEYRRGFTLVETAIVITIIALLTGGVLKGNEMLHRARINNVIKAYTETGVAMDAFRDKYGQWPGDMANARHRLTGCNDGSFCTNGNADGIIGVAFGVLGIDSLLITQANLLTMPQVETAQFWKHLALDGVITSVRPNADPAVAEWGVTHPATAIAGGFHIGHVSNLPGFGGNTATGTYLALRGTHETLDLVRGWSVPGWSTQRMATPQEAKEIDDKIDDGKPRTGVVHVANALLSLNGSSVGCGSGAEYDTTVKDKACLIVFKLK